MRRTPCRPYVPVAAYGLAAHATRSSSPPKALQVGGHVCIPLEELLRHGKPGPTRSLNTYIHSNDHAFHALSRAAGHVSRQPNTATRRLCRTILHLLMRTTRQALPYGSPHFPRSQEHTEMSIPVQVAG